MKPVTVGGQCHGIENGFVEDALAGHQEGQTQYQEETAKGKGDITTVSCALLMQTSCVINCPAEKSLKLLLILPLFDGSDLTWPPRKVLFSPPLFIVYQTLFAVLLFWHWPATTYLCFAQLQTANCFTGLVNEVCSLLLTDPRSHSRLKVHLLDKQSLTNRDWLIEVQTVQ